MLEVNEACIWGKLKVYKRYLTTQQYKTIKGQMMAGDFTGANKGLDKLLKRRGVIE